jgi:hypothetical protein
MLIPKKHAFARRTFLRGTAYGSGIAVALPLLEAMLDSTGEALAQGGPLPKRFISWMFGSGFNLDKFEPTATGPGWALSPSLAQLSDLKSYLNVCTGLQNPNNPVLHPSAPQTITHHNGLTVFSGYQYVDRRSSIDKTFATDWGGPTIDQVIADAIGKTATLPFRSLQFGVSKSDSPVDGGTAADVLSVRRLAAGSSTSLIPLPCERNPAKVWETIFGAPPAPAAVRTSMLDFIKSELGTMRGRLGTQDRARVDAHLEGIRSIERRIQSAGTCTAPTKPTEQNTEVNPNEKLSVINKIMADLAALAFACDLTRVASVRFSGVAAEVNIAELGAPDNATTHHLWSHALGSGYDNGIAFTLNRFGDWMRSLRDRSDPTGGNLLDSTILYCSSEIAWGPIHQIARHPVLLGGRGRNYLTFPGTHFQGAPAPANRHNGDSTAAGNSTSNVLFTVLKNYDSAATSAGGGLTVGSTLIPEIKAGP